MAIKIYYPTPKRVVPRQFVAQGTYHKKLFCPQAVVLDLKSLEVYVGQPFHQNVSGSGVFWSFFFELPNKKAKYCMIVFDPHQSASASVPFEVEKVRQLAAATVTINFPRANDGVPRSFIANATCVGCSAADGDMQCNNAAHAAFDEISIGNPGGGNLYTLNFNITETTLNNPFRLTVTGTGATAPRDTEHPITVNNL